MQKKAQCPQTIRAISEKSIWILKGSNIMWTREHPECVTLSQISLIINTSAEHDPSAILMW